MRSLLLSLVFVSLGLSAAAEPASTSQIAAAKNFPLFAAIDDNPAAARELAEAPALRAVLDARLAAIERVMSGCGDTLTCRLDAFVWTPADITRVGQALGTVAARRGAFAALLAGLRTSGLIERHASVLDADLAARVWEEAAAGVNRIVAVYGRGEKPRYPAIDSASHDAASTEYARLVSVATSVLHDGRRDWRLFYQPSLAFAVTLLELNRRDEAGRHEPLASEENQAALRRVASVNWQEYPYTVILVPGAGPDRPGVSLDPQARLRLVLAVRRFRERQAPYVLVSGGYVHPNQTPYNEAIEMKKALMTDFGVPEDAILVDPHARHTTTNLRNAARIMIRGGIPSDRPALVTSDQFQSAYIESPTFHERCDRELGYRPYILKRRLSPFDLEWLPRRESLHADPADPLDPH